MSHTNNRIVSLCIMVYEWGWSLTKIDQELQDGTLETCYKNGKTSFIMHKEVKPLVTSEPKADRFNRAEVGRFVNRKG